MGVALFNIYPSKCSAYLGEALIRVNTVIRHLVNMVVSQTVSQFISSNSDHSTLILLEGYSGCHHGSDCCPCYSFSELARA